MDLGSLDRITTNLPGGQVPPRRSATPNVGAPLAASSRAPTPGSSQATPLHDTLDSADGSRFVGSDHNQPARRSGSTSAQRHTQNVGAPLAATSCAPTPGSSQATPL